VWLQDEMRYGQQRTLTHGWSSKATRPRAVKQTEYDWSYVHAAVCPETDESSAMILPPYSPELNEIERLRLQIRLLAYQTRRYRAEKLLIKRAWRRGTA